MHRRKNASACKYSNVGDLQSEWVGLKIRRPSGLGGSTPPPGTTHIFNRTKQLTEVQSFTFPALSRLQTLQCPCSVLKLSATGDIAHRRHTVTL